MSITETLIQIHVQDTVVPQGKSGKAVLISKNELIAVGRLDVGFEDFNFDMQFTIISYNVTTIINGFTVDIVNLGAEFSPKTKELINNQKKGSRIYFENIKVKGSDGIVRIIDPLVIKLK